MQINLKFKDADFENLRVFEKAVQRQIGANVYVGTDSLCLYFDYPRELIQRLRPLCPHNQLEFTLESSVPDAKK